MGGPACERLASPHAFLATPARFADSALPALDLCPLLVADQLGGVTPNDLKIAGRECGGPPSHPSLFADHGLRIVGPPLART